MATKIFVNLPVKELQRAVDFFCQLGFHFNAQFSDDNAACLMVSADIHIMLLVEKYFNSFTHKPSADARRTSEMILSISAESRQKVDELFEKALKAGGRAYGDTQDEGWMYARGFEDLDGHMWEFMWMDKEDVDTTPGR